MKVQDLKIGTEYIVSNAMCFYRIKIVDITKTSIAFIDVDMREEVVDRYGKENFDRDFHIQEQLLSEAELFAKFRDAITPSNYPDRTVHTDDQSTNPDVFKPLTAAELGIIIKT